MPSDRAKVEALKNLLSEVDLLISTATPLPENRTPRCRELLCAAVALANDLLNESDRTRNGLLAEKGPLVE
jgi:hypothetical protein